MHRVRVLLVLGYNLAFGHLQKLVDPVPVDVLELFLFLEGLVFVEVVELKLLIKLLSKLLLQRVVLVNISDPVKQPGEGKHLKDEREHGNPAHIKDDLLRVNALELTALDHEGEDQGMRAADAAVAEETVSLPVEFVG